MKNILDGLEYIGLTDKEAKVYLALLEQGRAKLPSIVGRTKLPRSTTHHALRSLCERGLIVIEEREGGRAYQAEQPQRIETLLALEQQQLDERRRAVDTLLPKLKALAYGRTRPTIRYIETVEGLRKMQKEVELLEDDIIQIIGYDAFQLLYEPELASEHREVIEGQSRKIRSIIISSRPIQLPSNQFTYCVLPPSLAPIEGEMSVCGDRLMLFSYAEGVIAIDIQSSTLAQTARSTLEFAWKEACRLVPVQGNGIG
jgi:sugar-specific transcriptional regulator TrmB